MKLGIFGGSFDPPHRGHVRLVQEARHRLGLDRVLFVPTANPPHKAEPGRAPVAPALRRFAMVEMALLEEEGLFASPFELRLDRATYTVETLEHFRSEEPEAELHLLVGSDSLAQLETWRRWRELPKLARLVVLGRSGSEPATVRAELPEELRTLLDRGGMDLLADLMIDVSSTEIRRRLSLGEPVDEEWLHPLVLDYATKYRLYR